MAIFEGLLRAATTPGIVQVIDGKPLPVGGASHDPDARNGHGAGKIAKGYKLHAIWGRAAVPEAWSVEPLNVCETKAAEVLLASAPGPGGYCWATANTTPRRSTTPPVWPATSWWRRRGSERRAGPSEAEPVSAPEHRIAEERVRRGAVHGAAVDRASIRQCHLLRGRAGPAAGLGPKDVAGMALDMGEVDDQRGADPRETRTYVAYAIS